MIRGVSHYLHVERPKEVAQVVSPIPCEPPPLHEVTTCDGFRGASGPWRGDNPVPARGAGGRRVRPGGGGRRHGGVRRRLRRRARRAQDAAGRTPGPAWRHGYRRRRGQLLLRLRRSHRKWPRVRRRDGGDGSGRRHRRGGRLAGQAQRSAGAGESHQRPRGAAAGTAASGARGRRGTAAVHRRGGGGCRPRPHHRGGAAQPLPAAGGARAVVRGCHRRRHSGAPRRRAHPAGGRSGCCRR